MELAPPVFRKTHQGSIGLGLPTLLTSAGVLWWSRQQRRGRPPEELMRITTGGDRDAGWTRSFCIGSGVGGAESWGPAR